MRILLLIVLLLITATGCDNPPWEEDTQYQLMTSGDGSVYRLNKETGQVAIINGDKITPLKLELSKGKNILEEPLRAKEEITGATQMLNSQGIEDKDIGTTIEKSSTEIKDWGEKIFKGKNLKIRFQSTWKEEVLQYELTAYPYASLQKMLIKKEKDFYYQRKWHGFVINLVDNAFTVIKTIPIKLWDMVPESDNNEQFSRLVFKSKLQVPEDIYIRVTDYTVDWKLDRLLIPDYEFYNKVNDLMQTYSWYGEVDPNTDKEAPVGAKYWWITFPDKNKVYFSTEEELLESYKSTVEEILRLHEQ